MVLLLQAMKLSLGAAFQFVMALSVLSKESEYEILILFTFRPAFVDFSPYVETKGVLRIQRGDVGNAI